VKKDNTGAVTSVKAAVKKVADGKKISLEGDVIAQLAEAAAGQDNIAVTVTVRDSEGNTKCKIKANTKELAAGNKLCIYQLDASTGDYVMVNAKTYTVTDSGDITVSVTGKTTYELVSKAEADSINRAILKTVKLEDRSLAVARGKSTEVSFSSDLNMKNVKRITYSTSKKTVATVSRSGKVTAKRAGTATVKAKVTLKNGTVKTVSMKIKVTGK